MIQFGDRLERVRFDAVGIKVNERLIAWEEVGALGIFENASRRGAEHTHGGPMASLMTGCLAVCVVDDVDVVPALGLLLDCITAKPQPFERDKAIAFLRDALGHLWDCVPQFAPAGVRVEDWWREQVYGHGSRAHTDRERIAELRAELQSMRDRLDH